VLAQSAQPHGHAFRRCAEDLLALLFGISAIDISTFTTSRRSKPVRFDSGRQRLSYDCKSHPIFSQYWGNNYSNDQEFCHGVLVFTATYEKLNMPTAILLFG
jgi:hypothetical protein